MKYINKVELKQKSYTNAELRAMVNKRVAELNARLPNNEQLQAETEYILEDIGYINKKGKISTNKYISRMNKTELVETFNELTSAIRQDTQSPLYHANVDAKDKMMLKKVNASIKLQGEKTVTMEQFQEYIKIRDEFGDIFGKEDIYEVVKKIKKLHQTKQRPLIELLRESKEHFENLDQDYNRDTLLQDALSRSGVWEYQTQAISQETGELLEKPKGWKKK